MPHATTLCVTARWLGKRTVRSAAAGATGGVRRHNHLRFAWQQSRFYVVEVLLRLGLALFLSLSLALLLAWGWHHSEPLPGAEAQQVGSADLIPAR